MNLLIWGGPVFAPGSAPTQGGDVGKLDWGAPENKPYILTINHGPGGGFGSDAFAQLAAAAKGQDGRILPGLLAMSGLKETDFDQIAIAGFSAFHGLASPLLLADGDRISAAVLLDACFETVGSAPKPGFRSFAARAASGEKLMVMVGSSGQNGPGLPPTTKGYECALSAAMAGANDAGSPMTQVEDPYPGMRRNCGVYRSENLWVINNCDTFPSDPHGGIVKYLTEETLQAFLVPYLTGASSDLYSTTGGGRFAGVHWSWWLAGGAAAAIAVGAGVALASRDDKR